MNEDFARNRSAGPQRSAEIAAQGGAGPDEILLDHRAVEADAAVELRHALGRDLGVGPEHDRDRIARDQPDHQEDDDRHAEQHDDEIEQACEKDAVHDDACVIQEASARRLRRADIVWL